MILAADSSVMHYTLESSGILFEHVEQRCVSHMEQNVTLSVSYLCICNFKLYITQSSHWWSAKSHTHLYFLPNIYTGWGKVGS